MPMPPNIIARRTQASAAARDMLPSHQTPTIGLALGGGGARGLAHILMLEAFDDLGIKPKLIAGTSIGAIFGAAYASGIPGAALRAHAMDVLSQRFALMRDLFAARAQPMQRLLNLFSSPTALLNAEALLDLIMPKGTKDTFSDLAIPLKIVASDFYEQEPKVFDEGALRPAIAASMALPAVFEPVVIGGRAMIDGGLTNPLPYDLLAGECDIVVAIDVSGSPMPNPKRDHPSAVEALFASAFLFERSIIREKLRSSQPDVLIHAGTGQYQALEFLKYVEILAAAEPAKERLKSQLARVLSVETLAQIEAGPAAAVAQPAKAPSRLTKRKNRPGRGG
jgi:NTE family protein